MTNIVTCSKCHRSLIEEESSMHRCGCQIIDINYKWWINSEIKGIGEVIIAEDEHGTLYRFKPTNRQLTPLNTNHEDNGTLARSIVTPG